MTIDTAKIDQNEVKTWLAYNETTGLVEQVRVDPVFGYVEVFVVEDDGLTPSALNHALIDQNKVKTKLAYNENTVLVEALRCGQNGELKVIAA